jgi:hypothetical protein
MSKRLMKGKYLAISVLAISAATLLGAAFMHSWWSTSTGGFGLTSGTDCAIVSAGSQTCETSIFATASKFPDAFVWAGRVAFVSMLAAGAAALTSAGLSSLGPPRTSIGLAPALVLSVMSVAVFLFVAPFHKLTFGLAFYLYWIGIVAGVGGRVLVKRAIDEYARSKRTT